MTRSIVAGTVVLLAAFQAGANGAATKTYGRGDLRKMVSDISQEHGVDPRLVDAVVRVESDYDARAISRRGAQGLMQLMPDTADRLDVGNPFDPEENIRGGVREISRLVDRYAGNLQLALAAYNAGEGAVARYRGIPPYKETRSYVSKILTLYTGKPFRLAGTYRAPAVRMLRDRNGNTIITNVSAAATSSGIRASSSGDGPLRGGFGSSQ